MAVTKIHRSSGALPQVGFPTGNTIRVDSDDDTLKFGTGASGTTEKVAVDESSTQTITGDKTFTGTVVMSGAVTKTEFADGTVSLPSITFSDDLNSGLYRIGADNIGITVGGAKIIDVGATTTTVNKVTITQPTTTATLTLVTGSSLITSGAYATTLTATNTTNVTLPTTGTLATLAGSETLSGKTLTAPIINAPAGATSTGLMITKRVLFTENATNTVHTGTVVVPAGAWIHDICVTNQVLWTATTAVLKVGDSVDDDGWFTGVDCKATDLLLGEVLSANGGTAMWGGKNGAYLVSATGTSGPVTTNFGNYYVAGSSIIGVMTVGTPATTAGRTIMSVTYSVGEALAAVASA